MGKTHALVERNAIVAYFYVKEEDSISLSLHFPGEKNLNIVTSPPTDQDNAFQRGKPCSFVSFRTEMQKSIIYFQIPSRISILKKIRLETVKEAVNATRKARYRLLSGRLAILNCRFHFCHFP